MASVVDVQPVEVAATPAPAPAPAQNSLYVGDLDKDVLEEQLYGIFAAIGQVASVRVCRDAVTRRSLGYAYVNYNGALDPGAATRAMDALNFSMVAGKPIRIMWSQRDPSARKSAVGNIFIKNLDKSIDNKSLHDTFVDFGKILSCKVATDASGQSHGYGFVHFESEESAERSIALVNGKVIENKIVTVCPFLKRNERPIGKDLFTNVYIKNLPADVDDAAFEAMVKEFGELSSAVVSKDEKLVSKAFGFVNFKEPESAAACVEALNGKDVGGKVLFASKAQKKVEREAALKQKADEVKKERIAKFEGMNLYVKNLADEVEDEVLREHFDGCGTIVSCKVMKDAAGKSKGFGFVCFTTNDEAIRGVTEKNGKMFKGKPLYVALAQRKDVRKQQQERAISDQRVDNMTRPGPMAGGGVPFNGAMPYYAGGPMNGMNGPRPNYGFNGAMPMGAVRPIAGPQPGGPGGRGGRGAGPVPMQMGGPQQQFNAPPNQMMQQGGGRGARGGRGGRGQMGMPEQQYQQMGPMMPFGNMPPGFNPMYQNQMMQMNYPQQQMMMPQQFQQMQQPQQQMMQQQGPPMQQQQMMAGGNANGFNGANNGANAGNNAQGGRGGRGGRGGGAAAPKQAGQAGGRGGRGSAPPPPPASAAVAGAPAVASADLASAPLSASVLVSASPEQQKQLIGERLYPEVSKLQPELAGKITGMLLEMENQELLLLLEDAQALQAKVDEAITVLKQHNITAEGESAVAATEA